MITRSDYEAMREGPPFFQLIEGDLIMSPSPTSRHQQILLNLATLLFNFLEKKPLGKVFIAPLDVFLTDINIFQPDIVFVVKKRQSRITPKGIEGAPDLVVEISSPATAAYDEGSKRKLYAKAGVQELWLVRPETREIVQHLLKDGQWEALAHPAPSSFTSGLFPGLKIELSKVFKQ